MSNIIDIIMRLDAAQVERGIKSVKASLSSLDRSLRAGTELGAKFGLGFLTAQGAAMLLKNEIQHVVKNLDELPGITQDVSDVFRGMTAQVGEFRAKMNAVMGQMMADAPAQILALVKGQQAAEAQVKLWKEQGAAIREANEALERRGELERWFSGEGSKIRSNIADAAVGQYSLEDQITYRQIDLQLAERRSAEAIAALDPMKQALEIEKARLQIEGLRLDKGKQIAALKIQLASDTAQQRIRELASQAAQVSGDFGTTEADKWRVNKRILGEQIDAQNKLLATLTEQRDLARDSGDLSAVAAFDQSINQAGKDSSEYKEKDANLGADPYSLTDQLSAAFTGLSDQWGTLQQQIGRGIASIAQSLQSGIAGALEGVITKTMTWRDAFASIATTVIRSVLTALVDMASKWVVQQFVMAAAGKVAQAAAVAALVPIAAAASAIWATPATLATIATVGGAAAQAPASITLAKISVLSSSLSGFAEGGPVRGAGSGTSDSILARLSNGEYVIPAARVSQYGEDMLDAIRGGRFDSSARIDFAAPAVGGGGGSLDMGAIADRVQIVQVATMREAQGIARQSRARGDIVRIVSEDFGLPPRSGV